MGNILYNIFHPEIFQGSISKRKYFEGWYYKLVSSDEQHAIAIIPGIAIFNKKDRHSFIQTFNGANHTSQYHRFPIEDFKADRKELAISIGNNYFTKNGIALDLPEIKGEISFSKLIPPNSSFLNPGIMGWYAFIPYMQCNHGIVSLFHQLEGHTAGELGEVDWDNGIGYIEKDWGTSFPLCWIWLHCNHFHTSGPVSLMASIAHIPWLRRYFPGFIVVFRLDEMEYRFATYNNSKMKCLVFDDIVLLDFQKNDLCLSIKAYRGETASLQVPLEGQMVGKLNESLNSSLEVTLIKAGHQIWSSKGTTAGLDVSGNIKILESAIWRK